jgi:hypothetical protein
VENVYLGNQYLLESPLVDADVLVGAVQVSELPAEVGDDVPELVEFVLVLWVHLGVVVEVDVPTQHYIVWCIVSVLCWIVLCVLNCTYLH